MIKSMTGFGKAEETIGDKKILVETRSLNSRQLDVSVRSPYTYRTFEAEIRAEAARLQRGKVDLFINIEEEEGASSVIINKELFANYYNQLKQIAGTNELEWGGEIVDSNIIPAILRLPDVVSTKVEDISDEERKALLKAVARAVDELDQFRSDEGAILVADILERIEKIKSYLEQVAPYEEARTKTIKERIKESIESLGLTVDENRLEQELVFYVERLDVTEEKVRLANHCEYFSEVAKTEEMAGRKLSFISQEIGREINTLGSKANEVNIQRLVVQMKDEHEKIKEQLLNIL